MISNLKQWLYTNRITKRRQKESILTKPAINLGHRIALLFTDKDDQKSIDRFIKRMEGQNRQVTYLIVVSEKSKEDIKPHSINPSCTNWYGWPTHDNITTFLNQHYDLLLCPTVHQNNLIEHLLQLSAAHCKIATKTYLNYADLIVDVTEDSTTQQTLDAIVQALDFLQPSTT